MCVCGYCGFDYRFNESFDGVVLAYDVQIQDKIAKILPGFHPHFGVKLKAKLLLFAPKPNMLLGSFVMSHLTILGLVCFAFFSFLKSTTPTPPNPQTPKNKNRKIIRRVC